MSFDGGIPTGFKETEIGPIPEDWDVVAFGDHYTFQNGVNADKKAYGKGIRFANVLEVITHSHLSDKEIPGQVQISSDLIFAFQVAQGDILFNRTSETQDEVGLASVYVGNEPVVFGGFVIRGRPISDAFDLLYSGYGFRAPIVREQIVSKGQGAVRANIGQAELRTTWLPLPPLPEQRAIAEALSDADGLIAELESLAQKKRDLKQAAAQTLLTGQTRLPGFSGDWREVKLGELLSYEQPVKYIVHSPDYGQTGTTPVLTAGKSVLLGYTEETDGIYTRLPTIIFDDFTTAAKFITYPFKVKSSAMKMLTARDGAMPLSLIYELMKTIDFPLLDHKRYWISEYQHLTIKIPPTVEEQTAIASILSNMDAETEALEAQLAKTRDLKTGMMQDLLTGRVRLTNTGERRAA